VLFKLIPLKLWSEEEKKPGGKGEVVGIPKAIERGGKQK